MSKPITGITLCALILVLLALGSASHAEPQGGPKASIAVSGFGLNSEFEAAYGFSESGGGLSAMLASELQRTGHFLVVERPDLTSVFSEQELTAAGLVRHESAATPGQLIGAQILVFGEVTGYSQTESGESGSIGFGSESLGIGLAPNSRKGVVEIDVRLVDATSGQIISTFSVRQKVKSRSLGLRAVLNDVSVSNQSFSDSPLGKAARKAIAKITDRIVADAASVPWSGRVVDVDSGEIAINAGTRAGIESGEQYQIYRITKILRDPATGRVLGERKRRIGAVVIDEVTDELAFGRFVSDNAGLPQNNDLVTL